MTETVSDMIAYRKMEDEEKGHVRKHITLTGSQVTQLFYELRQEGVKIDAESEVNGIRLHGVTVLVDV